MAVPTKIRMFLGFYYNQQILKNIYGFMQDYVGITNTNGNLPNEEWMTYGGVYEAPGR